MSAVNAVYNALQSHDLEIDIKQLENSAHTAQQAADALGCDVAQIVKSLVFKTAATQQPLLVLVSGDKRLDINKLASVLGQPPEKADANFVKATTGFSIGGVAPLGSSSPLPVYMDKTLLRHASVWAAAGHPKTVFEINPDKPLTVTNATVLDLTCRPGNC